MNWLQAYFNLTENVEFENKRRLKIKPITLIRHDTMRIKKFEIDSKLEFMT